MKSATLIQRLKQRASAAGFDVCRIGPALLPSETGERLEETVALKRHGTMAWLAQTLERRKSPHAMWPEAKSAIVLGMNYGPDTDPMVTLAKPEKATISVYARNRDYHDIIKGKLKELAGWLASKSGAQVKVFVDTAPLMEKPLAAEAGVGWQGKHTNLVSREFGSWLFLGTILTDLALVPEEGEVDHCGTCRACLDICPTDAFPAPYQLDARRCISYLTIEHDGAIPREFRASMGNRIYGCDDCLAVCPWNKFASETNEIKLAARDDLQAPNLGELVQLNDEAFRRKFSGSPIKRIKRSRFVRNVLIAIGNSGSEYLKREASRLLNDEAPEVRGAAVWALSQLEDPEKFSSLKKQHLPREQDATVREEWDHYA